jgi:hypothetical protein
MITGILSLDHAISWNSPSDRSRNAGHNVGFRMENRQAQPNLLLILFTIEKGYELEHWNYG